MKGNCQCRDGTAHSREVPVVVHPTAVLLLRWRLHAPPRAALPRSDARCTESIAVHATANTRVTPMRAAATARWYAATARVIVGLTAESLSL